MPVTAESFLWEATGFSPSGTSVVVTHPDAGGTTAGMTVLVLFHATVITAVPAGFASVGGAGAMSAYAKSNVAGGETSWTFTLVGSTSAAWYLVEMDDVALADPGDGSAIGSAGSTADGGTRSTGTAQNAGSSGIAFAVMGVTKVGTTDVQSWSGWTNGFTERVDVAPASGTAGKQIAAAFKLYDTFSSFESTVTLATSAGSANAAGQMVLLRSADASINAPLLYCTTFGFGTHAGMNASTAGTTATMLSPLGGPMPNMQTGTWGTQYSVGAFGRDGRTGLDITLSASTVVVALPSVSAGTFAFGGNIRPVSGSGSVVVAEFSTTSGRDLVLSYDTATEKFGLVWYNDAVPSVGTTVWQTGTSPLGGGHVWVDIRMSVNSSVHHAEWSIETGTGDGSQTSPADETSTVQSGIVVQLGVVAVRGTQTSRFQYGDIVYSRYAGAYPLGPHVVRVLAPETTGATVSGSGTFNRFTANGTLAAVNGTEGALLDDIPPTVSASSDGVVQASADAASYIQIPMTTYTLAADEIIAGVRAFASLWGGTGSGTGTLGFRGWDGTTEATFVAASASFDPDSLTTASATYPMWYAAMWGAGSAWNQTKLDAAALRGGFSTDATPDMGFSCMGLEVATRETAAAVVVHRLTSDEDPEAVAAVVTETLHPYSSGVRTYTVSNGDATRTAEFRFYETGGGEHADSPVTVAPLDPPVDVTVGAEVFGEIESTTFGWL